MNKGLKFNTHKNWPEKWDTCDHYNEREGQPNAEAFNLALSTVANLGRRLDVNMVAKIVSDVSLIHFDFIHPDFNKRLIQALSTAYENNELTEDV